MRCLCVLNVLAQRQKLRTTDVAFVFCVRVCMCMCQSLYVCVCVCVCVFETHCVRLLDRDTVCMFWLHGEEVTGSEDPISRLHYLDDSSGDRIQSNKTVCLRKSSHDVRYTRLFSFLIAVSFFTASK